MTAGLKSQSTKAALFTYSLRICRGEIRIK